MCPSPPGSCLNEGGEPKCFVVYEYRVTNVVVNPIFFGGIDATDTEEQPVARTSQHDELAENLVCDTREPFVYNDKLAPCWSDAPEIIVSRQVRFRLCQLAKVDIAVRETVLLLSLGHHRTGNERCLVDW